MLVDKSSIEEVISDEKEERDEADGTAVDGERPVVVPKRKEEERRGNTRGERGGIEKEKSNEQELREEE